MIGKIIEVRNINYRNPIEIVDYLHQYGSVVGEKTIRYKKKLHVFIIEFRDYSRIWMLPEEIEQKNTK